MSDPVHLPVHGSCTVRFNERLTAPGGRFINHYMTNKYIHGWLWHMSCDADVW